MALLALRSIAWSLSGFHSSVARCEWRREFYCISWVIIIFGGDRTDENAKIRDGSDWLFPFEDNLLPLLVLAPTASSLISAAPAFASAARCTFAFPTWRYGYLWLPPWIHQSSDGSSRAQSSTIWYLLEGRNAAIRFPWFLVSNLQ